MRLNLTRNVVITTIQRTGNIFRSLYLLSVEFQKYRIRDPTGRDVFRLDGHDLFFGKYGNLIGEWILNGCRALFAVL